MPSADGVSNEVLEERLRGMREDLAELRQMRKDDHHRLRSVEAIVKTMVDSQKSARAGEARQYRRVANAIAFGGLCMALAMLALAIVTILLHG